MTTTTLSITVKKSQLAENGDYNLTMSRYIDNSPFLRGPGGYKWPMVQLGEVCDVQRGTSITKKDLTDGDVPVIAGGQQPAYYHNQSNRTGKTITVSGSGAYAGFVNYFQIPIFASDSSTIQSLNENETLTDFVFYLLKGKQQEIYKLQSGMGQPHVYTKDLKQIQIPLPPLSIQEQITSEIEQYQKVIDGAKQVVENWKPSFRINPSWEMVELGGVVEIQRGGSPRPIDDYITKDEDGINWIKIGDVPEGDKYITKTKQKIRKEGLSKTRLVKDGDFILSNSMSFGRPYIVKIAGAIHDGWLLIRINNQAQITSDFLYQILGTEFLKEQYSRLATGGVVRNLNSEIVRGVKIPLPPLSIQKQIVAEIEAEQKAIEECKKLIAKMQKKVETKIGEVWGEEMK
jgi:type I restriction enzyme M protein